MSGLPRSLNRAVDSFEERYLERAREALALGPASIEAVSVRRRPMRRRAGGVVLAGWWCEQRNGPEIVLPNPWDDRKQIAVMEKYCWEVSRSLAADLGRVLNEILTVEHTTLYWELVLLPWLIHAVPAVVDRRLFCVTVSALAPDARWEISEKLPVPGSLKEADSSLQSDEGNSSLLTMIAEQMDLLQHEQEPAPKHHTRQPAVRHRRPFDPASLARGLYSVAVKMVLRATRTRRVLLTGPTRFTPTELLALRRQVRGLSVRPVLPFRGLRPPPSELPLDDSLRQRASRVEVQDPRAKLLVALLPQLFPRSLLEGYSAVVRQSERDYGPAAPALVANYCFIEAENEFIARARSAGKRVAFAQHGGAYLQIRTHAFGRLELREDSLFVAWGKVKDGPHHIATAPDPRLARLRDSHRGGDDVVIVDWLTPPHPHVIEFSSYPLANQGYDVPARLAEFVGCSKLDRGRLVLKSFPTALATKEQPPVLQSLSREGPSRSPSAAHWMQRARLTVVPYPDTPFIEAMVIGVPTIGLWSPKIWEMRDDAGRYFEELAQVGVVHSEPEAAAAMLDAVYADATAWWQTSEIQRARRRFLNRFAVDEDWRPSWVEVLQDLASSAR